MPLPTPAPGLVIRYAYLWRHEHHRGQEEGVKNRPCAIVLTARQQDGDLVVTVVPVTHRPPTDSATAVLLPMKVKRHLGLDAEASWIIADEVNRFVWPGPDLRPVSPARPDRFDYGFLPEDVFETLRRRIVEIHRSRRLTIIVRST